MNGYVWMALSSLLFAFLRVLIRLASPHAPWAEVAAVRTVTGAFLSIALARTIGVSLSIGRQGDAWGRSVFGTIGILLLYYVLASPKISVGDVAALSATSPLFVALIAPFLLKERSEPIVWLCVVVSFAGIILIAQPKFETAGVLTLLTLAYALTSALGNMFMRRVGPHASAEAIVLHFAVVSAAALLAIAIWTWTWPSAMGWLLMAATGITGCLAQLTQTRAYALVTAARIGIFGYIGTVFTQIVAVLVLGEEITLHQILGSLLIIASGVLLIWARTLQVAPTAADGVRPTT